MRRRFFRILAALLSVCCLSTPSRGQDRDSAGQAARVEARWLSSDRLSIWFQAAEGMTEDTRAVLWYTSDGGDTWKRWGDQAATKVPIEFDAPADGLYGFFVVLKNASGESSPPPGKGTAAQQWIGVDREAPSLQILSLRPDARFDLNREIHIRWKASDEGLPNRPVVIHYRSATRKSYALVAEGLPATGEISWTVPEDVDGKIEIKISATDAAGNTGRYLGDKLTLRGGKIVQSGPPAKAESKVDPATESPGAGNVMTADAKESAARSAALPKAMPPTASAPVVTLAEKESRAVPTVSEEAAGEAKKLYEQGSWHRMRGEHELAVARYQEALKLDGDHLAARNDLAGVLCVLKRYKEAESQFRLVLWKDESNRVALRGLALVQATQRDYQPALATLSKLLLLEPNDADAWLYFGDVELFAGDRIAARQAWRKVESLSDVPEQVRQQAQRRLAIYAGDR
jgi:Flp pilus assembly protein TadD